MELFRYNQAATITIIILALALVLPKISDLMLFLAIALQKNKKLRQSTNILRPSTPA